MKLIYRCLCAVLGAILTCPNIERSFAQGNIRRDDFCDVWETRYQVFRDRRWLRTGDCADCKEWGARGFVIIASSGLRCGRS
jgi:radical SAM protein with 4Fe4S-binding SPASM domain